VWRGCGRPLSLVVLRTCKTPRDSDVLRMTATTSKQLRPPPEAATSWLRLPTPVLSSSAVTLLVSTSAGARLRLRGSPPTYTTGDGPSVISMPHWGNRTSIVDQFPFVVVAMVRLPDAMPGLFSQRRSDRSLDLAIAASIAPRGVVRLTICNAGSLHILGSAVIFSGVREGLQGWAADRNSRCSSRTARATRAMIAGRRHQENGEARSALGREIRSRCCRDPLRGVLDLSSPVIARMPGWCLVAGWRFVQSPADFRLRRMTPNFVIRSPRLDAHVIHAAVLPRLSLGPGPLAVRRPRIWTRHRVGLGMVTCRAGRRNWTPGRATVRRCWNVGLPESLRSKGPAPAMGGTAR